MPFLNMTIEYTTNKAINATIAAGGSSKDQDTVMSVMDQSRIKMRVHQNNIRTWIGEMEDQGYHVVDAEIAISPIC